MYGLLMATVVVTCGRVQAEDPPKIPNIDYVFKGYNIFKGNPHNSQAGVDPGFSSTSVIFDASYDGKKTTGDGRYLIPDHVTLVKNYGCDLSFASEMSFKQSAYQTSLETDVRADFEGFNAAFSASVGYQQFSDYTQSKKLKMVASTAECTAYTGAIDIYTQPKFTDNFQKGMDDLPADYGTGEKYFSFFDEFGTHLIKHVTMGARFGYTSYIDEKTADKIASYNTTVKTAASYDAAVKVGGHVNVGHEKSAQEAFHSSAQYLHVISLGAKPTSLNATEWSQQIFKEPMPIRYNLLSICEKVSKSKSANCLKGLSDYCTKHLINQQSGLHSCEITKVACVWSADCPGDPKFPSFQCVEGQCKKLSSTVKNLDWVYLKHVNSQKYFMDVKSVKAPKGMRWPAGKLGSPKGLFRLQIKVANDDSPISDGQVLRVVSKTTTSENYNYMCVSKGETDIFPIPFVHIPPSILVKDGIYFVPDHPTDDTQTWTIKKFHQQQSSNADDIIRTGDTVYFQSAAADWSDGYYLANHLHDDWIFALQDKQLWVVELPQDEKDAELPHVSL